MKKPTLELLLFLLFFHNQGPNIYIYIFYLEKYLHEWNKQQKNSHVLEVRKQEGDTPEKFSSAYFKRSFQISDLKPSQKYLAPEVFSTCSCVQMESEIFQRATEHPGTKGSVSQTTCTHCLTNLKMDTKSSSTYLSTEGFVTVVRPEVLVSFRIVVLYLYISETQNLKQLKVKDFKIIFLSLVDKTFEFPEKTVWWKHCSCPVYGGADRKITG